MGAELGRNAKTMAARAAKLTAASSLSVDGRLRATKKAAPGFEKHAARLERGEAVLDPIASCQASEAV
jgi:hypothetical protein